MEVVPTKLSFATWKLANNRRFVWSRWGDGEVFCAMGIAGKNSNGCTYYPELGAELREVLKRSLPYYWGMRIRQTAFVGSTLDMFFKDNGITHKWYDQGIFSRANRAGKLKPVVDYLRSARVLYIGPQHLEGIAQKLFGEGTRYIVAPDTNAWDCRHHLLERTLSEIKSVKPDIIGLSIGLFAKVLLDWIYPETEAHIVDFGSIWDIYAGISSRGTYRKRQFTPEWFWAVNVRGEEPPQPDPMPDITGSFGVGGRYVIKNILFVARRVEPNKLILMPLRKVEAHENPKMFRFPENKGDA